MLKSLLSSRHKKIPLEVVSFRGIFAFSDKHQRAGCASVMTMQDRIMDPSKMMHANASSAALIAVMLSLLLNMVNQAFHSFLICIERVLQEHRDGHRADTSRDGGDCRGFSVHGICVAVSEQMSVNAADADVNDVCSCLDVICCKDVRFSDGGDQDVRCAGVSRKISGV